MIFKSLISEQELMMKIRLKCFSDLVSPESCNYKDSTIYELAEGQTVEDLIECAGINRDDVKIAFVNNRIVDFGTLLCEGDRVGLSPAVGGM